MRRRTAIARRLAALAERLGLMRQPPLRPVSRLATWSRNLAAASVFLALIAIAGSHIGWFSPEEALLLFSIGLFLAVIAGVLAAASLLVIWRLGLRGAGLAIAATFLVCATLTYPAFLAARSLALPALTDVSTDVEEPVAFDSTPATIAQRSGYRAGPYPAANAEAQRTAYPAIQPLIVSRPLTDAANLVAERLEALGLALVRTADAPLLANGSQQIEATDRSALLRLVDDIAVRLTPLPDDETRIDIRSVSRLGKHDLGVNAARIQRILDDLAEAAQQE
jgi:uncharacterized protein (DUF1499 family)